MNPHSEWLNGVGDRVPSLETLVAMLLAQSGQPQPEDMQKAPAKMGALAQSTGSFGANNPEQVSRTIGNAIQKYAYGGQVQAYSGEREPDYGPRSYMGKAQTIAPATMTTQAAPAPAVQPFGTPKAVTGTAQPYATNYSSPVSMPTVIGGTPVKPAGLVGQAVQAFGGTPSTNVKPSGLVGQATQALAPTTATQPSNKVDIYGNGQRTSTNQALTDALNSSWWQNVNDNAYHNPDGGSGEYDNFAVNAGASTYLANALKSQGIDPAKYGNVSPDLLHEVMKYNGVNDPIKALDYIQKYFPNQDGNQGIRDGAAYGIANNASPQDAYKFAESMLPNQDGTNFMRTAIKAGLVAMTGQALTGIFAGAGAASAGATGASTAGATGAGGLSAADLALVPMPQVTAATVGSTAAATPWYTTFATNALKGTAQNAAVQGITTGKVDPNAAIRGGIAGGIGGIAQNLASPYVTNGLDKLTDGAVSNSTINTVNNAIGSGVGNLVGNGKFDAAGFLKGAAYGAVGSKIGDAVNPYVTDLGLSPGATLGISRAIGSAGAAGLTGGDPLNAALYSGIGSGLNALFKGPTVAPGNTKPGGQTSTTSAPTSNSDLGRITVVGGQQLASDGGFNAPNALPKVNVTGQKTLASDVGPVIAPTTTNSLGQVTVTGKKLPSDVAQIAQPVPYSPATLGQVTVTGQKELPSSKPLDVSLLPMPTVIGGTPVTAGPTPRPTPKPADPFVYVPPKGNAPAPAPTPAPSPTASPLERGHHRLVTYGPSIVGADRTGNTVHNQGIINTFDPFTDPGHTGAVMPQSDQLLSGLSSGNLIKQVSASDTVGKSLGFDTAKLQSLESAYQDYLSKGQTPAQFLLTLQSNPNVEQSVRTWAKSRVQQKAQGGALSTAF